MSKLYKAVAGDDGEESFLSRLEENLKKIG